MIKQRILQEAYYILEKNATIRQTATVFSVSKSTVHKDVSTRLKHVDYNLYKKVKCVLDDNFAQKHIRGGIATQQKFQKVNH